MDSKKQQQQQKQRKQFVKTNVLEALKEVGNSTARQGTDLLKGMPKDFMQQLMGMQRPQRKFEGEINPGESLAVGDVLSGKREKEEKLQKQLGFERTLRQEESALVESKSRDLRLQLQAVMAEVQKMAASTAQIAPQIEIATMQAPVNPGIYHIIFFEKLLEFIKSFRKKIDNASVWLQGANKRAQKKNYWSQYKKLGSSFLLNADHYNQRSAG